LRLLKTEALFRTTTYRPPINAPCCWTLGWSLLLPFDPRAFCKFMIMFPQPTPLFPFGPSRPRRPGAPFLHLVWFGFCQGPCLGFFFFHVHGVLSFHAVPPGYAVSSLCETRSLVFSFFVWALFFFLFPFVPRVPPVLRLYCGSLGLLSRLAFFCPTLAFRLFFCPLRFEGRACFDCSQPVVLLTSPRYPSELVLFSGWDFLAAPVCPDA